MVREKVKRISSEAGEFEFRLTITTSIETSGDDVGVLHAALQSDSESIGTKVVL